MRLFHHKTDSKFRIHVFFAASPTIFNSISSLLSAAFLCKVFADPTTAAEVVSLLNVTYSRSEAVPKW